MDRYTFRLPDIGEGIAEAEIVAWHVAVGDNVPEDGRLADLMTDKATVEMESPVAGRVVEIAGEVGEVIAIGSPLVVLEVAGEAAEDAAGQGASGAATAPAPGPRSDAFAERIAVETSDAGDVANAAAALAGGGSGSRDDSARPAQGGASGSQPGAAAQVGAAGQGAEAAIARAPAEPVRDSGARGAGALAGAGAASETPSDPQGGTAGDRGTAAPNAGGRATPGEPGGDKGGRAKVLASPAVRQRARDLGIDLTEVRPADDGRVRHADLDAFLTYSAGQGYAAAGGGAGRARPDEMVKVIGLRRRIAENMAAAKRHIPHFTYVEECDVTALEQARAQLNSALSGTGGARPKLTLLPLLIAALCRALPDYPMLNARYDDEANVVTRHGAVHLGMATATPAGLMVPVIRDAQAKNLVQLAAEIVRLSQAARDGSASLAELSGSTITISSLGPLGGIASTPVVNRPEVAILAPNRIVERPMFVSDELGGERLAKRKLMNLSISCDHRVVDGHDAASFVQAVKRLLEAPALLLAG